MKILLQQCSQAPPVPVPPPPPQVSCLHTNAHCHQKQPSVPAPGTGPCHAAHLGTAPSSQRQSTRVSEAIGQGKEERTGNEKACSFAILANQAQTQMQASREHLREVYISAGFHSCAAITSHAKLISPGYSSREG